MLRFVVNSGCLGEASKACNERGAVEGELVLLLCNAQAVRDNLRPELCLLKPERAEGIESVELTIEGVLVFVD